MAKSAEKICCRWKFNQVQSLIGALFLFMTVLMLQFVAASIVEVFYHVSGTVPRDEGNYVIGVSALGALLCIAWCGYWYRRLRPLQESVSYRQAFSGWRIPAIVGIAVGGCLFLSIALSIVEANFPDWFHSYKRTMSVFSAKNQVMTVLYTLLVAPVSEELIFRGAIMERFHVAFPFWMANCFQALLFGVYHMNLIQGLYAFALGLVLGLVRMSAGTVTASMLTHVLFNATSYMLQQLFPEGKPITISILFLMFFAGIVSFGVGLWYTIHNCVRKSSCVRREKNVE